MSDIHISEEILRAHRRGIFTECDLIDLLFKHVAALCPHCRKELKRFEDGGHLGSLHPFLQFAVGEVKRHSTAIVEDDVKARRDLHTLLKLPFEAGRAKVLRARTRFRSLRLAELLVEASGEAIFEDPALAEENAALAAEVVWASKARCVRRSELLASAFAHRGNALRMQGDFKRAEYYIDTARAVVRSAGVTDTYTLAEIDRLEGVLRHMLRSLREAETLQRRAVFLYTLAGATQSAARMLIALGYLHSDLGEEQRAIEMTETAIILLDESDTRSLLYARHNLTWSLCNLERYEEAETLFEESQELYTAFPDPWTQLRREWIRARIDAGVGRKSEAEACFLNTFEKLHTSGYPYDALLLVLDLVDLYLKEGKMSAVAEIAETLSVLFEEKGVHQGVVSALRLFQERARQEAVTESLRRRLSRYLIEARHRPELRFSG